MLRNIIAAIVGIAVAVLTVMLFDWISHSMYPVPENLDVTDSEALAEHVKNAPLGPLILVLSGWLIGTFDGVFLACMIAPIRRSYVFAVVVGGLMLVATVSNLIMIPHPVWMTASAVIGIPLVAWVATLIAPKKAAAV